MRFNLDDYKGKYAMWCKTEEEAESFCRFLDDNGKTWNIDTRYIKDNNWDVYKENTCYFFNEGLYANLEYAQQHNYTVLRWDTFEENSNTINSDNNNNNNNDTINNSNDDKIIIEVQDYSENYGTKLYKIPKSNYNLLKTLDDDFDLFGNDIKISILDIKKIKEL